MAVKTFIQTGASEDRFEKLIQERLEPGADKEKIDERIWELFGETWAIMFTDLSGFSRRVKEFGIIHFLQTIYESHRILVPQIDAFNGILIKVEGDSLMVLFKQPQRALDCAIAMQQALHKHNRHRLPEEQVLLCVGIGYGRLLKIGDEDVFGTEVNAASKLGEDTAKAWEILITQGVRDAIEIAESQLEALAEAPPGASGAWRVNYSLADI
ncbi:MAG: adenylate cyclase [Candidatus Melainabacteria bacterium HGW-Melainabacteria-1]|nr:MAG: adenylate cyclase [Candidatus Melainabacteria bacterium HGW-Melainabacteria-1]